MDIENNNTSITDLNGNGPRRPSVTMGIGHLLKSSDIRRNGMRNGNVYSPTTELEISLKELRYSISTQVNGQDLSNASHEESLEVLQSAPEPIIIEVLRRNSNVTPPPTTTNNQQSTINTIIATPTTNNVNNNNQQNNESTKMRSLSPNTVTASTQTDGADDDYCSLLDLQSAASLAGIYPFITQPGNLIQPNCRQGVCFPPSIDLGLTDLEMANDDEDDPVYEEPWDLVRSPIIPAFEYEEVVLDRASPSEKLGLTLCYESTHSNDEEDGMDVFVSEIEADSIAANDGRIREGDQILQINNTEVRSREEAIQLFAVDCQHFTLVLARQILQVDDGFVEDKSCGTYEDLIPESYHQKMSAFIHNCHGEELCSTDTASTSKSKQDSGLGRTDDSIRTESSEQECLGDCPGKCCHSNDSFTSNETTDNNLPHPGHLDNNMFPGYTPNCDNRLADALSHHNNNSCHGKPPQSPSNKSDSNSYKSMSVSSNSSCHSSPLRQQGEPDHIYDEPMLTPPKNLSPSNTYQREICELNKEIENMRMECQKITESNKQELEKCASPAQMEPVRSPRMVPRMGTRLDYLRQIQAIQQYGQMSSWIRQNQWAGLSNGKENSSCQVNQQQQQQGKMIQTPAFPQPYSVSNVSGIDHPLHSGLNNRLGGGLDTIERELQYSQEKDVYKDTSTTSAYNTGGESCRSTPLTLELHPQYGDDGGGGYNMSMLSLAVTNGGQTPPSDHEINYNEELGHHAKKKSKTSSHSSKSKDSSKESKGNNNKSNLTKSPSSSSVSHMTQTPEPPRPENLQNLYAQYAEVMYTNQANLHHTIMVQQKLFQQQLVKQAKQQQKERERSSKNRKSHDTLERSKAGGDKQQQTSPKSAQKLLQQQQQQTSPKHRSSSSKSQSTHNNSRSSSQSHNSSDANNGQPTQGSSGSDNGNVQMEWVVKLRPDGSRYIARRPIRSKILKERAKKLAQERCGMTTDDDAMSELKIGRYCRREDRKRHLEKAKEYKKKKELMMKQKLESLKENEEQKEPNIIDLSHRKMMKHKNKKVLDDFVTVQEMLVHGNRVEQPGKVPNPLLSVTTV